MYWSKRQYTCHMWASVRPTSNSAEVCKSMVLNCSCCVVRIELPVKSLSSPSSVWNRQSPLEEGASVWLQLPLLTQGKLSHRHTHFPLYGRHQTNQTRAKLLSLSRKNNLESSKVNLKIDFIIQPKVIVAFI